jgi:hypothetical protein
VIAAFFIQLDMGAHRVSNVGDATVDTDALNRRTADARYMAAGAGGFLPLSGGQMTGTLIAKAGTGSNDHGVAFGDNTTGFWRSGNSIVVSASNYPLAFFDGDGRAVTVNGPLNVGGYIVSNIGNASLGTDALNRNSGDARYPTLLNGGIIQGPVQILSTPVTNNDAVTKGYVDQSLAAARAPSVIFDLPNDVLVVGDSSWQELASVIFPLTRTGLSRIQVTLNCNMMGVNNVASIGARLGPGGAERRLFAFGVAAGTGDSVGFTCNLYFDTTPGVISIPIQVASLPMGAGPQAFTILGGSVPMRSQIVIVDLGPVA